MIYLYIVLHSVFILFYYVHAMIFYFCRILYNMEQRPSIFVYPLVVLINVQPTTDWLINLAAGKFYWLILNITFYIN